MNSPSSCDENDVEVITVDEALNHVMDSVTSVQEIDEVNLESSHGRVLAIDINSPLNVPPHPNSAMDGYALNYNSLSDSNQLHIVGTALAGHPYHGKISQNECVQVMTGSVIPMGCDTVVQQEHVSLEGNNIHIMNVPRRGANIRLPGEDIAAGDRILKTGQVIHAAELGMLASLGFSHVEVKRLPRVAYFSTGDELRNPGEPLGEGEIYDSNRATLLGLLEQIGVEHSDFGRIPDNEKTIRNTLMEAAKYADIILSSGGASVGSADHISRILREQGKASFWKIAMKPGKPLNFGQLHNKLFFGLPGNPVSLMVTFALIVAPALRALRGETPTKPLVLRAKTRTHLRKTPGRVDYQRGKLMQCDDGTLEVETTGMQSSHILSGMSHANCLIRLQYASGSIDAGTLVDVIPFYELFR